MQLVDDSTPVRPALPLSLLVDGAIYGLSPFGGLIRYWDAILTGLASRGVEVTIELPTRSKATPPTAFRGSLLDPNVHVSTYYGQSTARGLPSIVVVHDLMYETWPDLAGLDPVPGVLDLKRRAIEVATAIVVPSKATAAQFELHYPDVVCPIVIPSGIDRCFSPEAAPAQDQACRRLLEQCGVVRPFLLYVGGRAGYKDFPLLLKAVCDDPDLRKEFAIVVVGSEMVPSPEERLLLERLSPQSVYFLGYLRDPELAAMYRAAACVVATSQAEGFGFVPVEAIACASSLACTDIAAHRETVLETAELFPSGDIGGCADAIKRCVRLDRRTSPSDSSMLRSRFDWDLTVDRFSACCAAAAGGVGL